ncbi:hypothetical protein AM469_004822 [Pseudomonas aeruginosa]|nr:hypothetical protein AM469_004822 [Pseudomonas aeruginosa]
MPKTLRQKLLLALIALLLIVAGYYWNVGLELFNEQPTRPGQDNTIDYYAENAHSLQYQEDGSLDYEMTAVKLEHQKATDITFVTTPDLLLFRWQRATLAHPERPRRSRTERQGGRTHRRRARRTVPMPRANQAS